MDQKVRVHTIIFTEACPLACRYCDLKNDPCFDNGSPCMTKEQIFYLIDEFDKKDDEIIPEVDVNTVGTYTITYTITTDSSTESQIEESTEEETTEESVAAMASGAAYSLYLLYEG